MPAGKIPISQTTKVDVELTKSRVPSMPKDFSGFDAAKEKFGPYGVFGSGAIAQPDVTASSVPSAKKQPSSRLETSKSSAYQTLPSISGENDPVNAVKTKFGPYGVFGAPRDAKPVQSVSNASSVPFSTVIAAPAYERPITADATKQVPVSKKPQSSGKPYLKQAAHAAASDTNVPGAPLSKKRRGKKGKETATASPIQKDLAVYKRDLPKEQQHLLPMYNSLYQYEGRRSVLSETEQQRYLAMMISLQSTGKFRYKDNSEWFKTTKAILQAENVAFNDVVKKLFMNALTTGAHVNPYLYVHHRSAVFVENILKAQAQRVEGIPAQFFSLAQEIATSSDGPEPIECLLKFSKSLLEVGKLSRVLMPNIERRTEVHVAKYFDKMTRRYPPQAKQTRKLVCEDANVTQLIDKYGPQIIAAGSALKRLLVTLGSDSKHGTFDIPVLVKVAFVMGRMHKVVILNQSLKPGSLSAMEINQTAYKYACRTLLVHPKSDVRKLDAIRARRAQAAVSNSADNHRFAAWADSTPAVKNEVVGDSHVISDAVSVDKGGYEPEHDEQKADEDSNDESSTPWWIKKEEQQEPAVKRARIGQEKNIRGASVEAHQAPAGIKPNLLDKSEDVQQPGSKALPETPVTAPVPKYVPKFGSAVSGSEIDTLGVVLELQKSLLGKPDYETDPLLNERVALETPTDYVAPSGEYATTYDLWSLNELTVLVRTHAHALLKHVDESKGSERTAKCEQFVPVTIVPKLEYQPLHGGEVFTEPEALDHWATTLLKRPQFHLQPHVGVQTGDIVSLEKKPAGDLFEPVKAQAALATSKLCVVLRRLLELPEGWHLLRHKSGEQSFAVFSSPPVGNKLPISLPQLYVDTGELRAVRPKDGGESAWRSIDPQCVLQWHRIMHRVPASFRPRADHEAPSFNKAKTNRNFRRKQHMKAKKAKNKVLKVDGTPKPQQTE